MIFSFAIDNQRGGVGAGFIFAGVIFFVLGYFYFYPAEFAQYHPKDKNENPFCRPYVNKDGSFKNDAPIITAPSYSFAGTGPQPIMGELVQ